MTLGSIIVMIGKPNAGKGTWLKDFIEKYGHLFEVISVSGLLKKEIAEQTEYGKKAKSYMDEGVLVPDSVVIDILLKALKDKKKSVLLDGFPRSLPQAKAMFEANILPNLVIEFAISDEDALNRSKSRIVCSKCGTPYSTIEESKMPKVSGKCDLDGCDLITRKEDTEEKVLARLKEYMDVSYPALDYFKSKNINIFTFENTDTSAEKELEKILIS